MLPPTTYGIQKLLYLWAGNQALTQIAAAGDHQQLLRPWHNKHIGNKTSSVYLHVCHVHRAFTSRYNCFFVRGIYHLNLPDQRPRSPSKNCRLPQSQCPKGVRRVPQSPRASSSASGQFTKPTPSPGPAQSSQAPSAWEAPLAPKGSQWRFLYQPLWP